MWYFSTRKNLCWGFGGLASVSPPSLPVRLSTIRDNKGALNKRKRVGRGPSSGKGKTSGRGHKGQKARSGNGAPRPGFAGGQTPLVKAFPKRGFTNVHQRRYTALNLGRLQRWIDLGRLDPSKVITVKELVDSNCVHGTKEGVRLLAGEAHLLRSPVNIRVSQASSQAIERVEAVGGTIRCVYHNALGLRAILKPGKFFRQPKQALPTKRRDIEYYSDPKHRGYLASGLDNATSRPSSSPA
ncbi:MAG: ribosomal protein L18e/L15P [Piptocephalis tieghemiana]|nr:MAG: ribosomal protein L18e/L15P [Piptocephalis tieghemiana]